MEILVIGGTRNVGHHLILALVERGHRVTTFNRGRTPDELGSSVERLHGDRRDPEQLRTALGRRAFDAVVDTIAMTPEDTRSAVDLLDGRTGHYVHFSTGQVYLVRQPRPFVAHESDYAGPVIDEPGDPWGSREWRYGIEKRGCEERLQHAWGARGFPATALRLPMIHGERDHYGRIHGTLLRMLDGAPLLVAAEPGPPLRHIDALDVVSAVVTIIENRLGIGGAYNVSQDASWPLDRFLETVARLAGVELRVERRGRAELIEAGVFPACSPFSNPWMSVLDNDRARRELGLSFSGFDDYLPRLVRHFLDETPPPPASFVETRPTERALLS